MPAPEDGGPGAVIVLPAITDAMTLDLIYVLAVFPKMKSVYVCVILVRKMKWHNGGEREKMKESQRNRS